MQIKNNAVNEASAIWLEAWPHWIKVYMHTLQVTIDGLPVAQCEHTARAGLQALTGRLQLKSSRKCTTDKHNHAKGRP